MNKFEMTERGKIVVALVLLVVLLIIPTVIILISMNACADSGPPAESPSSSQQASPPGNEDSPVISNTPLPPDDSGVTPSAPETPDVQETPDSTPAATPEMTQTPDPTPIGDGNGAVAGAESTPQPGPIGIDLHEGTMIFIFLPDVQNVLDEETVDLLKEFLTSPKNNSETMIKVEMPRISSAEEDRLTAAVLSAFSLYDIKEGDLLFVKNNTKVTDDYIEVALSFTPISGQK